MEETFLNARKALSVSVEPEQLPGREKEVERITKTLKMAVETRKGLTMFITGGAGTGKTTTTRYCIRKLEESTKGFCEIYINAVKLKTKKEAFTIVWKELQKIHLKTSKTQISSFKNQKLDTSHKISNYFLKRKTHPYIIIIIDELDYLKSKDQTEIYEFFNWPQIGSCCVIGIANTVAFSDQLIPKISSRLEITEKIIFQTYSHDQLLLILKNRVEKYDLFTDKALEYCARKIASSWGDIRKGLSICQKAIDKFLDDSRKTPVLSRKNKEKKQKLEPKITIEAMNGLFSLIEKVEVYPIEKLNIFEKLFLCAVNLSMKNSKEKDGFTLFENVVQRVQMALKGFEDEVYHNLSLFHLKPSFDTLVFMNMVEIKTLMNDKYPRVKLTIDSEDVEKKLSEIMEHFK